jgi:hypothetical protein
VLEYTSLIKKLDRPDVTESHKRAVCTVIEKMRAKGYLPMVDSIRFDQKKQQACPDTE